MIRSRWLPDKRAVRRASETLDPALKGTTSLEAADKWITNFDDTAWKSRAQQSPQGDWSNRYRLYQLRIQLLAVRYPG